MLMDDAKPTCLNCNTTLSEEDKYCKACGQKTDAHLLTLGELFANLWSSLTNLDNSAFKTLKHIWAPWQLTKFYVEGKKKSFLNPVRIFLITLVLHFGVLISSFDLSNNSITKELYTNYEKNKMYKQYKSIKEHTDTITHLPLLLQIDTILFKDGELSLNDTITNFHFNNTPFKLKGEDIIEMSIDTIYQKYGYTTFIDKLVAKQLVKSFKDPDGTIKYVLGNLIWAILLTILILAGFYKLIYFRKKLPYVEHLIFLLNVHSLAFIANSLLLLFSQKAFDVSAETTKVNLSASFFLIPTIIFVISLYKYYKQSFIKTSIKAALTAFVYAIINLFFIFLTGFISFLIL